MPLVTIVAVVLAAALATFGWMAGRIMSDNDRRIDEARQRPAATSTVTVNPPGVVATSPPSAAVADPLQP